jgi:hypothetical protein
VAGVLVAGNTRIEKQLCLGVLPRVCKRRRGQLYAARYSRTTGRWSCPPRRSTSIRKRPPSLPATNACGRAHADPRGQAALGSRRGRRLGQQGWGHCFAGRQPQRRVRRGCRARHRTKVSKARESDKRRARIARSFANVAGVAASAAPWRGRDAGSPLLVLPDHGDPTTRRKMDFAGRLH